MSDTTPATAPRPLLDICKEIRKLWVDGTGVTKIRQGAAGYGAEPYFGAMLAIATSGDDHAMYYEDTAKSTVVYFLSNAASFRGEDAKRIKLELRAKYGIGK
jgi:hypothetical protein